VVFIAKGLLQFTQGSYVGYLQSSLLQELKVRLFDAYGEMDYRYYVRKNTGHLINVINQQVDKFFLSFQSFAGFLTQVITGMSYFAFAFAITWQFSLMALLAGGVLASFFKYLNRYVRELSRMHSRELSGLNKLLVQSLQSLKYIISTNQSGQLRQGVTASVDRLTGYILRQRVAGAFTSAMKEPASVLLIIGLIVVQVTVFEEPVTPIFVALLLFHRGMQTLVTMQAQWQTMMNRIGAVEMVDEELQHVEKHAETRGNVPAPSLSESVAFRDVSFAYDPEDGNVLKNINLEIQANTTVAFVGESGAGKTTLIDMLTLLLKPQTGRIEIDGVSHDDVDPVSWRSQIGYVSQETVVFDDTIANNISLWTDADDPDQLQARIEDAARRAYAHDFIQRLPDGYDTVVGDRGIRLSGGQRQRLFIARELFKEPNLLILDEATSALDTESERHIQKGIDQLKGTMTVAIIAHRLSTIKNVDHIYILDRGTIKEEGTFEELYNESESRFRGMIEMQSF